MPRVHALVCSAHARTLNFDLDLIVAVSPNEAQVVGISSVG